jgi:hypothetical protein
MTLTSTLTFIWYGPNTNQPQNVKPAYNRIAHKMNLEVFGKACRNVNITP